MWDDDDANDDNDDHESDTSSWNDPELRPFDLQTKYALKTNGIHEIIFALRTSKTTYNFFFIFVLSSRNIEIFFLRVELNCFVVIVFFKFYFYFIV